MLYIRMYRLATMHTAGLWREMRLVGLVPEWKWSRTTTIRIGCLTGLTEREKWLYGTASTGYSQTDALATSASLWMRRIDEWAERIMLIRLTANENNVYTRAGKKLGFLEKVFKFLGFLGFLDLSVQRQPDKNLPSRKNILDPINHSPGHFVLYKL